MKLLAIDLGASSGRAILGELNGKKLSLTEVHRFANEMIERGGHKHWDVHRLRREMLTALRKTGPGVESVGIDTWGVDYGYVKGGEVIGLPFAYRDGRTQAVIGAVHDRFGGHEGLYRINGLQFLPFNTIYQMAEDAASRPEVFAADRMLMMPELLGFFLTGKFAAEYSIASTSGLLDARTRTWSDELRDALRLPRRLFSPVSQPGGFRADLLPETGLRAKLILPGCHDTASAVAATPMTGDDAMYISSGTWSLAGVELDEPVLTDAARRVNFTNEGGVGGKIRFLKNVMGLWLVQELQRLWAAEGRRLGFGEICAEAEKAPPFRSLINPNLPRFLAPKDMRAEIQEECRRTGQPVPEGVGPLARCVFEGLALAYRECLDQVQALTGRTIRRVHIVGGGVQNRLLCRMTADACGVPVAAGPVEATALGNLLVQAIALGAVGDIEAARGIVRSAFPLDEYTPGDRSEWESALARWRALPA